MTIYDQAETEMAALQSEFLQRNDVPTVLVVDDDPDYNHLISTWISPLNWFVEFADDGDTALRLMDEKKIDLIWLDLKMPRMNGVEFVSRVKVRGGAHAPIIVVTGVEVSKAVIDVLRKNGVIFVSTKPDSAAELKLLLEKVNPKTSNKTANAGR